MALILQQWEIPFLPPTLPPCAHTWEKLPETLRHPQPLWKEEGVTNFYKLLL